MSTLNFVTPKVISLKNHPTLNEQWLETRLKENPELLGLGDVDVRASQRRQPTGGRLDLLLQGDETRYEVEIQLGSLDESHIIRTIEYWDIERKRYPNYEHVAVIVAEDVTSRFLNVISLLSGSIPLIAIQIKAIEVNGSFTLVATRVVDLVTRGTDEEDESEATDRASWQRRAPAASMQMMDTLVGLVDQVQPGLVPKYNKGYVGLASPSGTARNFVIFRPRKKAVLTEFKIPQDDEFSSWLADDSGLDVISYSRFGRYRVQVRQADIDQHRDVLLQCIRKARDAYTSF